MLGPKDLCYRPLVVAIVVANRPFGPIVSHLNCNYTGLTAHLFAIIKAMQEALHIALAQGQCIALHVNSF